MKIKSWSNVDVKAWVCNMGPAYVQYAEALFHDGVTGIDLIEDFDGIMNEMNFEKNIHLSKIQREWIRECSSSEVNIYVILYIIYF